MSDMPTDLDPGMFVAERKIEFELALAEAAARYSKTGIIIAEYETVTSPEAIAGQQREVEESKLFEDVTELLGAGLAGAMNVTVEPIISKQSKEDYEAAIEQRAGAAAYLVGLVSGSQKHWQMGLGVVYDDEPQRAEEESWERTWDRVINVVQPLGGTILAEVADFFDELVKLKYALVYDPTHTYRGKVTEEEVSTRTFYEKFQPHLPRAIMRSGEDSWTGH